MAHDDPRQKLIALVKEQLAQEESKLAETEARLVQLREDLAQLQDSVAFFRNELVRLMGDEAESAPGEINGGGSELSIYTETGEPNGGQSTSSSFSEDEDIEGQDLEDDETGDEGSKRNPKQMLRPEYARMKMAAAAQVILDRYKAPLTAEYIAKIMFEEGSDEENFRAKNSLSAELRRGAKDGRWRKLGRGLFVSNSVDM